jgi:mono/diheme cytochrome c family protein
MEGRSDPASTRRVETEPTWPSAIANGTYLAPTCVFARKGWISMVRTHTARLLFTAIIVIVCAAWIAAASRSAQATRADGLAAWQQVYSVLTHPRCINCHTATNYPQQGDDRHRHFANVIRGPEDKGVPGLNCAGCHQDANADSTGVPGGHNWHLAPLSMTWQDLDDKPLSSAAVCRAVTDRSKNHNLDGPGLLKHHEKEPLVLWAWNPGRRIDGAIRTVPPLTHAQFVDATRRWIEAGIPCP